MMTIRIGLGIGCRLAIQLVCFYFIIKGINGSVNVFVFAAWAMLMGYSKFKSLKDEIKNDVEDFVSEYQAYPLKKMVKKEFEQAFEILDQECAVYVKKRNPLVAALLSRLYFVVAKEGQSEEVSFYETHYDYM